MKTSQTFETIDRLRTLKDSKLGIKLGIEMYNAKKKKLCIREILNERNYKRFL